MIATIFVEIDIEAILFSNVDETTYRAIPEAFAQCTCKKEVVINFLSIKFGDGYKKLLYNKIKREFAVSIFYGLINALIYSYQKTWDEDNSKKILKRIEEIFAFANEKLGSLWSKENRDALREHMTKIYTFSVLNGVHAYFPAINQDPEPTSETTKK